MMEQYSKVDRSSYLKDDVANDANKQNNPRFRRRQGIAINLKIDHSNKGDDDSKSQAESQVGYQNTRFKGLTRAGSLIFNQAEAELPISSATKKLKSSEKLELANSQTESPSMKMYKAKSGNKLSIDDLEDAENGDNLFDISVIHIDNQ